MSIAEYAPTLGTAGEQSSAIAHVQAAIVVARQFPRSVPAALAGIHESCGRMRLAEKAFYRVPRGEGTASGPSIHLARELARCWGNLDYGLTELRHDDDYAQSQMRACAWDLQSNTSSYSTFTVPHRRDARSGVSQPLDMRDIYGNNANEGARRVRAAIFAVLPGWVVDEAQDLCMATLKKGGGIPLPKRIAATVEKFQGLGVSPDRLEVKLRSATAKWTALDVAQLTVIFGSLDRGEIRIDNEFPGEQLTAAELTATDTPQTAPSTDAASVSGHEGEAADDDASPPAGVGRGGQNGEADK